MKILAMVRAELARLTATVMSRIALLALLLVPVLYGGLYLWANQDPYAGLDRVPVALIVSDTGAQVDGAEHNYGREVATQLVDDGTFGWHQVSAAAGKAGVADATYDFSVTIPKNFSESIASSAGESPSQATITLTTNDTNSYLASTIGSQAAQTIREAIVAKVNKEAADRLLIGLSDVRSSLVTAADGAGKVTDGAVSAGTGSTSLADGAAQLATGTGRLATGAGQLATATGQVSDGAAALAAGASSLAAGTGQVATGAGQVSAGAAALATGTGDLATGSSQVAAGTRKLADGAPQLAATADKAASTLTDAGTSLAAARTAMADQLTDDGLTPAQIEAVLAQLDPVDTEVGAGQALTGGLKAALDPLPADSETLAGGAAAVADGAATARDGAARLSAGAAQTATGAGQAAAGAGQAATGAADLADGAAQTRDGAVTAAAGADGAATGASALASGATSLRDGLGTLQSGAGSLRDGLSDGVTSIPDSTAATRSLQGSTIADPVALKTAAVTSAGTYGAGLAPFFASLAGWIGIYALFLIVKPVSRRAITALHSPLRITLAGWLTPGLLGMAQMAALFAILAGVLKFEVHNPAGTYLMMGLAALAFAAIILALNVWLGSVGQFIGLVLMVVQLVTAGGTFPWQTLPAPLAWLHHVVPMSYAVDGIRQLMYGGNPATAWADAGVLLLWLAGALVLAYIGVTRMTHFRTLRDLRPSLIG